MPEMKTNPTPQQASSQTQRQKAKAERLRLVAANHTVPTMKVYASSADVHTILRHPGGMRLRGNFGTATEWPYDSFTQRRVADGTLSLNAVSGERQKADPKLGVREAAAARRPKPEDVPPVRPLSAVEEDQPQPRDQRPAQKPPAPAA